MFLVYIIHMSTILLEVKCKLRERSITVSELSKLDGFLSERLDQYRYLAFRYGNATIVGSGMICTEDGSKCIPVKVSLRRYRQGNVNVSLRDQTLSDLMKKLNLKPNSDIILRLENINVIMETIPQVTVLDTYMGKIYRGYLEFNVLELRDSSDKMVELSGYYILDIYFSDRVVNLIAGTRNGRLVIETTDIVREIPRIIILRYHMYTKQCVETRKLRDITLDELYRYRIMPIRGLGGYDDDVYLIKC